MDLPEAAALRLLDLSDFSTADAERPLAEEVPIAFEFNGLAYAVMMASPRDLEDFAAGFALSEGLARSLSDIGNIAIAEAQNGMVVRVAVNETLFAPVRERLRLRLVEGSCGLCGLESIEEVLRPLPPLTAEPQIDAPAITRALVELEPRQLLGLATGAMHAAAFCAPDGAVLAVREDIGRHNALDKLVGHLCRTSHDPASGFILLTARCSYELVEKTVRAGCPALVTISAPSDLAAERAKESGLTLVALARPDTALVVNDPHGRFA